MEKTLFTIEEESSDDETPHLVDKSVIFKVLVIEDYEASKDDSNYEGYEEDEGLVFFDIKKGQVYGITDVIEGGWLNGFLIKDTSPTTINPFDPEILGYLPDDIGYVKMIQTKKKRLKGRSKKSKSKKEKKEKKEKKTKKKKKQTKKSKK